MITIRATLPALAALAILGSTGAEAHEAPPAESLLTVQGEGRVAVAPDRATVTLGVVAEAEAAEAAQQEASRVASAIRDAVVALGIERSQIQTSGLSLSPVYPPRPPQRQLGGQGLVPVGYRASNVVSIRVLRLERLGPVIDAAVGAGANSVQGIELGLQDEAPPRRRALAMAVEAARAKAEAIAEAVGATLGEVRSIDEQSFGVQPVFRAEMMQMRAADVSTPVEAGEVTVEATVTVRWVIGPGSAD